MTDRELFIAALEKSDAAERDAWLDQACAADPERRRRITVLLRAHEDASQFLASPAAEMPQVSPTSSGASMPNDSIAPGHDVLSILEPAEKPDQLGKLDQYEILQVVGKGGMGVVLKAFDPKLHRLVAVKLMAPHLAAHAAARKRFEREARAIAAVKNENVVAIHGVEVDGPNPYLVMEFIGGVSLQERLEKRGPLELKEILRIGMQAARGLAAAHAQGLVHRDVKPANVLLENGVERVKLTDFGLARAVDDANLTQSGVLAGTPNYMSPEQAAGSSVDARSDLFSLGSVLYFLCTGHPPFRADSPFAVVRRVCDDPVRSIREVNADLPSWLDSIIAKLLAKKPEDRFQTATEVADLLGQYLAHLQQPNVVPKPTFQESPKSPRTVASRPLSRSTRWVVLMIILAGVGVAFLVNDGMTASSLRSGPHGLIYRIVFTAYMLLTLGVNFVVYGWGGRSEEKRGRRMLWDIALFTVVAFSLAGFLSLWDIVDLYRQSVSAEGWQLLGLFFAVLLVNLPTLLGSTEKSETAPRSEKPDELPTTTQELRRLDQV
jgi:serine/threonine protein kinase